MLKTQAVLYHRYDDILCYSQEQSKVDQLDSEMKVHKQIPYAENVKESHKTVQSDGDMKVYGQTNGL